jgi:hypothetical protein
MSPRATTVMAAQAGWAFLAISTARCTSAALDRAT